MSEEELNSWDAGKLEQLPLMKDFYEDFEPEYLFFEEWDLHVQFKDPNELF